MTEYLFLLLLFFYGIVFLYERVFIASSGACTSYGYSGSLNLQFRAQYAESRLSICNLPVDVDSLTKIYYSSTKPVSLFLLHALSTDGVDER